MTTKELDLDVSERAGTISAIYQRPRGATALYVLAHGAGAGMRHPFMGAMAAKLAQRKIATMRYQFPYMEQGHRRPSPRPVLLATVRAAVSEARAVGRGLPIIAGGKSMGGRMTSVAQAEEPLPELQGLAFLGFPLHAAGKPQSERGDHLKSVKVPMLFLQGSRDTLADLELMRPLCKSLGKPATLHEISGADHSFKVLKRSGRTHDEVLDELADTIAAWCETAT